ncbi:hypothetical protein C0T31_05865 [Dysgonamonadaceae bacterium]|nr:hypothetical protein C0T31_05865 [Dysgonamonadaceae bacterium]
MLLNGFHDTPATFVDVIIPFARKDFVIPIQKETGFNHKFTPFFPAFGHSSRRKPHSSFCRTIISPSHDVFPLLRNDQSLFEKVVELLKER